MAYFRILEQTLDLTESEQKKGRTLLSNVKFLQNLATKVCGVKRFGAMKEDRAAQAHLEWGW